MDLELRLQSLLSNNDKILREETIRRSLDEQANKNERCQKVLELQEKIKKFKDEYTRKKTSKEYFINE